MKRRRFLQALGSGATGIAAYSCRAQREAEELTGLQHSRLVEAGLEDRDLTWGKAPSRPIRDYLESFPSSASWLIISVSRPIMNIG